MGEKHLCLTPKFPLSYKISFFRTAPSPIVMDNQFLPNPLQPLVMKNYNFWLNTTPPPPSPPSAHDIICEQPLSSYDVFSKIWRKRIADLVSFNELQKCL